MLALNTFVTIIHVMYQVALKTRPCNNHFHPKLCGLYARNTYGAVILLHVYRVKNVKQRVRKMRSIHKWQQMNTCLKRKNEKR